MAKLMAVPNHGPEPYAPARYGMILREAGVYKSYYSQRSNRR